MKIKTISLIALQILPALTIAATVKNIVVFGDSNSDVGNDIRWSDGPLWSEYLAAGWNASLYNFAYSGSVCDNTMYKREDMAPSLKDQMAAYYKLKLDLKPEETVYAFWFGSQDIYEMAKRHGRQEPEYKLITECIEQQLKLARKVFLSDRHLLFNVAPMGQMPYYQDQDEEIATNRSQAAVEINKGLEKVVAQLNKHHHGLEMDFVEIHALVSDIVVNPKIFDIQDSMSSFLDQDEEKFHNAVNYLWWDKTHFTTVFHKMVAKSIIDAESYMPKAEITRAMIQELYDPKSRFRSEKYTIEAGSASTVLEDVASMRDLGKPTSIETIQPPLEEDLANYVKEGRHRFAIIFSLLIVGGIIAWIKFPFIFNWIIRNRRDRSGGKFIPVSQV